MATKEEREKTAADKAQQYPKADVIRSAANFGATPEMMAGALYSVEGDQLTLAEAKKALADFTKKTVAPVEDDGAEKGEA